MLRTLRTCAMTNFRNVKEKQEQFYCASIFCVKNATKHTILKSILGHCAVGKGRPTPNGVCQAILYTLQECIVLIGLKFMLLKIIPEAV